MIKINFLAQELAQERKARLRRRLITVYATAWLVTILIAVVQFQDNLALVRTYEKQASKFAAEIEVASPQFERAVQLYQLRNKSKKALGNTFLSTVEPGFILQTLQSLAGKTPPEFWLDEVTLSTTDNEVSADNKKKDGAGRRVNIKGNLFLSGAKNSDTLQKYQSEIQASEPFSMAQCQLNLSEMSVKRLGDKYSHNFKMTFSW